MGLGEELPEAGDGNPNPAAEASGLAADASGKECVIGRTIIRPLRLEQLDRGVERLAEMSSDKIERLLDQGVATPLAVFKHARDAHRRVIP